ncbi:hypothetical protein GQ44DRAFT_825951 [Phaeosphaeriaceae sp. PMI808]|nr:hypothetical protein GQ44DRAFT_825951 [Phaeosphaeriaceae sp. PMI808]
MTTTNKKKRLGSMSPQRSTTAKRMRQTPDNATAQSDHLPSSPLGSRSKHARTAIPSICPGCKQAFPSRNQMLIHLEDECAKNLRQQSTVRREKDPYLSAKEDSKETSLPSKEDWIFRVKVISSTNQLSEDVFTHAVQGLVKICFPQGILEELGVDLLQQHMRKEKAPKDNIKRMTKVFRYEMVRRVAWMLAEYLDTPIKVKSGIKFVIAASAQLHNHCGDLLAKKIISSFSRMVADHEETTANETVGPGDKQELAVKKKKKKKNLKAEKTKIAQDGDDVTGGKSTIGTNNPTGVTNSQLLPLARRPEHDDNIVSSSWRWNIDPHGLSSEARFAAFKQTSDLFAFHALPIARHALPANANRKEVREKIQALLDDVPSEEYGKWVESFQKLRTEDKNMLIRADLSTLAGDRQNTTTPAPITMLRHTKNVVPNAAHASAGNAAQATVNPVPPHPVLDVKREADANSAPQERFQREQDLRDRPRNHDGHDHLSTSFHRREQNGGYSRGHHGFNNRAQYGFASQDTNGASLLACPDFNSRDRDSFAGRDQYGVNVLTRPSNHTRY